METSSVTTAELGRAHTALLADLRKLKQMFQPDSGASLKQVCSQLGATLRHITNHFELEEQHGWIDAVRRQEPRWEHAIQQLVEEHHQVVRSLETLIVEADVAEKLNSALREKGLRWIERAIDHETREDALFEDAFFEDLGVGD